MVTVFQRNDLNLKRRYSFIFSYKFTFILQLLSYKLKSFESRTTTSIIYVVNGKNISKNVLSLKFKQILNS